MTDRRENILARLKAVVGGVAGITKCERNLDEIPENIRPAAVIFDGGEEAAESDPRRPSSRPRIISMTPQILILIGDDARDLGTTMNDMRAKVIAAINNDTTLAGHTLLDESVRYLGFETNLEPGRTGEGWGILSYEFIYLLKTSELTAG